MITFRKLGRFGRFGNQLFQYAGIRLYAELNSFDWALPDWIGNKIFQLPETKLRFWHNFLLTFQLADLVSTSWPERLLSPLGLWQRSSIENLYKKPIDNIDIYSYLQDSFSLELLKTHKQKIIDWFSFKDEIDDLFSQVTEKCRPWVGVHIRRGDLVKRDLVVPTERYLEILPRVIGTKNLFVASDNPDIVKRFSDFRLISIPQSVKDCQLPPFVFDFWMLVNADTILGGGSTFSWWAAYLNNKNSYYSPPLTHLWPTGYIPKFKRIQI